MMKKFVLNALCLVTVVISPVAALRGRFSTCGAEFRKLEKCKDNNNSECADCVIVGPFGNFFRDGFCDATRDSLCNGFGCCKPCEAEFEIYERCFARFIARVTFGRCEIDCEPPAAQALPNGIEDVPTNGANSNVGSNNSTAVAETEPDPTPTQCLTSFNKYRSCVKNNKATCEACPVVGPPTNPFKRGFCDAITQSVCAGDGCCDACSSEYDNFKVCSSRFAKSVSFGRCNVECESQQNRAEEASEPNLVSSLEEKGCLRKFTSYAGCVARNPLSCGKCLLLDLPDSPKDVGFCEAINGNICSLGNCCEACEKEFTLFDDCFEDVVSNVTGGRCQIECEKYKGRENCFQKVDEYADCVAENKLECGTCAILNLPSNPQGIGFCEVARDTFCGFGKCCEACDHIFDKIDDCFDDFLGVVSGGSCQMDCANHVKDTPVNCLESLNNYTSCVRKHPFRCLGCALRNLPLNPSQDGFCSAVTKSICEIGDCCKPCQDEFNRFDACFESFVSTVGGCEVDCDGSSIPAVGDVDTRGFGKNEFEAFVEVAYNDYTRCLSRNPGDCTFCTLPDPLRYLDTRDPQYCDMITNPFCQMDGCCSACQDQFAMLKAWTTDFVAFSSSNQCGMSCP